MQTGRCSMAWLEAGTGWPVIFVHAFPLTSEMWRPQLDAVPDGWRFIAPDLRGFGGTRALDPPPAADPCPSGMDAYAADLGDFMDCLELDDAVMVGLSMGGYVAFAMYRQAPARFNGLVLADTRPQADTPAGRDGRARLREALARDGTKALADQMLPKLLAAPADPALADWVRRTIERADPAGVDAAIVALMDRPDSTADLPRIACATQILVGELDEITPPADAEAMAIAIPRSTKIVIPGAGHLSNLERSDQFTRALCDFLLARL